MESSTILIISATLSFGKGVLFCSPFVVVLIISNFKLDVKGEI